MKKVIYLIVLLFQSIAIINNNIAQTSPDSLSPTLVEPTSICIDQFQCRFVENEANCFIKLPPSNSYLTIKTEQLFDTNAVNIANVSIYKITPFGNVLFFYYDYTVEFIAEIEVPGVEVGVEYFVSIKRNEYKPCLSCEDSSQKFSFCLLNQPKATPCLSPTPAPCQLVCNGSFASFLPNKSPYCISQVDFASDFNRPIYQDLAVSNLYTYNQSPDIFLSASINSWTATNCSFPANPSCYTNPIGHANFAGTQSPRTGFSYAGIFALSSNQSQSPKVPEMIQGSLNVPMVAGQKYYVRFFVSLADYSEYATENIGIHFHRGHNPATYNLPGGELAVYNGHLYQKFSNGQPVGAIINPQVINTNGVITDTQNWVEIRGEYIAVGNENLFTITNFSQKNDPTAIYLGSNPCGLGGAYYYVDDIAVSSEPFEVTISATSCGINGYTLTASSGFSSYVWSDGQTGQTITVANPSTIAEYQVIASNPSFGCADFTGSISLKPIIVPNVSILGIEYACDNNGTTIFSVDNFDPLATYQWSITSGATGTLISANEYQVNFGSITSDYTVNLEVTTNEGCVFYYSHLVKACCGNIDLSCIGLGEGTLFTSIPSLIYKVNYTASQLIAENGGNPIITGPTTSNTVWVFQGDLIIDTDITFQLGRYLFGKETGIVVQAGKKFTSGNVHLLPCDCNDEMWNGVQLIDANSELDMNLTKVYQAKAAVTSDFGAKYTINASVFRNCYNGLVVNEYNGNHNGTIKYTLVSSVTGQLIAPHSGSLSKTRNAVLIDKVNAINIGQTNTGGSPFSTWGGVKVTNAYNGITITNSNVTVKNSIFENCFGTTSTANIFTEGIGISSTSNDGTIHTLSVEGTNQFSKSTFTECNVGVLSIGDVDFFVKGNDFTSTLKLAGIITFGNSSDIQIQNNNLNFTGTLAGIYLWNVPSSLALVSNNQINYGAGTAGGNSVGIAAENFGGISSNLTIFNNQIKNCFTGLYVNNIPTAKINNNLVTIYVTQPVVANSSIDLTGINVMNSVDVEVKNNNVRRFLGTPNSDLNLNGITVENCPDALVQSNQVLGFGKGIYVKESNPNSAFYCNTLQSTFNGFSFDNAEIGNQGYILGGIKMTQDNRWLNPQNQKLTGDLTTGPINWVYKNGAPFSPFPQNAAPNTPNYQNATGGGILSPCPTIVVGPGPKQFRENNYGKIVRAEKSFNFANNEFNFANRSYAYEKLKTDTALVELGEPDDIDYQNFIAAEQQTDLGKIENLRNAIKAQNYALMDSIAQSLGNDSICTHLKTVNQVFMNTWGIEQYEYTAAQRLQLEEIACQSGLLSGPAVYSARAMLGWFGNCESLLLPKSLGFEWGSELDNTVVNDLLIAVYPNPANDLLTIEYEELDGESKISIYTIVGALVLQENLTNSSRTKVIDVSDLTPGVYFVSIKNDNEQLFTQKIVITR